MKLQEEEHQRKLIQEKAKLVKRFLIVFLLTLIFLLCSSFFLKKGSLFHTNMYALFVLNPAATDWSGDQQDPTEVSVTFPFHQSVQREEVHFEGEDPHRDGLNRVFLST